MVSHLSLNQKSWIIRSTTPDVEESSNTQIIHSITVSEKNTYLFNSVYNFPITIWLYKANYYEGMWGRQKNL